MKYTNNKNTKMSGCYLVRHISKRGWDGDLSPKGKTRRILKDMLRKELQALERGL